MGVYTNNARLIQIDHRATNIDVEKLAGKVAGLVINGVDGNNIDEKLWLNPKFGEQVAVADKIGVPAIMLFAFSVDDYIENAPNSLPKFDEKDRHVRLLDSAIYIGTSKIKRKISAILVDANNVMCSDGRLMTESNFKNYLDFFIQGIWKRYQIPVYIYINQSTLNKWASYKTMDQYLSTFDGICSWKSANPGGLLSLGSVESLPIPPDDYKPQYICNAPKIYFTRYANTAYNMKEIKDANGGYPNVPLWQYISTKEGLFAELGFVPATSVVVPPPDSGSVIVPPVVVPVVTVDLSKIEADLAHLKLEEDAELEEEKKQTEILAWLQNVIKKIFNIS